MTSLRRNARVAGLLYLTLLTAPLRLIYIQDKLIVSGNAVATADNIAAHQTLFRLGILSDLFTATMAIFLTLALYRLFNVVDQGLAVMVILRALMVTPILPGFNVHRVRSDLGNPAITGTDLVARCIKNF